MGLNFPQKKAPATERSEAEYAYIQTGPNISTEGMFTFKFG